MLTCQELTRIIASDEFADAGWGRRLAIRLHLFLCRYCRRYAAQLRAIKELARKHLGGGEPDPVTRDRLSRCILARAEKDGSKGGAGS